MATQLLNVQLINIGRWMDRQKLCIDTLLVHSGRDSAISCGAVNIPVVRASTRLYADLDAYEKSRADKFGSFRYGRYGTPTTFAFEAAVATVEGGYRAIAVPSGLAAIVGVLRSLLRPGDHLLVVDSVYGPVRQYCSEVLARDGIEATFYDPALGEAIAPQIRNTTRLIYCESPGSLTFEMQDIPAIARVAKRTGIPVIADNTWATPCFQRPFDMGIDISIHSATKYIVGHSDAMLGVIVAGEPYFAEIRSHIAEHGVIASPDDCWLGLRGLRTLGVRLRQHQAGALLIASWLEKRDEVARVLYPALPSDPGHAIWRRDFSGASGLLGVELKPEFQDALPCFVDALELFGIGSSWGGFESLVLPSRPIRTASIWPCRPLLRLHVGLEDPDDLISDLAGAFETVGRDRQSRANRT